MPKEIILYQYPTSLEPAGEVKGACLLPFNGEEATDMFARGQRLFELSFFTFFGTLLDIFHV